MTTKRKSPQEVADVPKNIEGDLAQRVENLESSLNIKHSDSLSDAIQTAESAKKGFISL